MSKHNREYNKLGLNEVANLVEIPNKEYISVIPDELKEGKICIGTTSIKGVKTKVYFSDECYDKNLIISGRMGSGKNQYLKNYLYDCLKNNIPSVFIDCLDDIHLTDLNKKLIDEGKMLVLDINDPKMIQSLSFNELNVDDTESNIDKIIKIQDKSYSILEFLDNISDYEFTNSMRKYLITASNIVYSVNKDASFKNIIDFLENKDVRDDFLNRIPGDLKDYLEDEIYICEKLNTSLVAQSSLERMLDYIYMLKQNMTLKLMMKQTSENNVDFTKCLEEGKSIIIKIDKQLCNKKVIDILNAFFIEKVNIASRMRVLKSKEETKKIHFIINNEIYSNELIKKIRHIIPNSRVQNLKLILAVQNSDNVERLARDLEYVGFNYMFLSGIDSSMSRTIRNLTNIKIDDIYDIPKYHSINLILNKEYKYDLFITKLPPIL